LVAVERWHFLKQFRIQFSQPIWIQGEVNVSKTATDRQGIDSGHEKFLAAFRSGDTATLLSLLTSDVMFLPPNEAPVIGKVSAQKWFERFFSTLKVTNFEIPLSEHQREVTVSGDLGVECGPFKWTVAPLAGGTAIHEEGKFVGIWRREPDGTWRIFRDIWNSNKPV
jgi:ketosteroid isomerase-like protein